MKAALTGLLTVLVILAGSAYQYRYNGERSRIETAVTGFYHKYLGREPDRNGLNHWVRWAQDRWGLARVEQSGFVESDEHIHGPKRAAGPPAAPKRISALARLDARLFLALNRFCHSPLDYVFGWTTFLIAFYLLPVVFLYMCIWEKKDLGRKFRLVAVSALAAAAAAHALKIIVDRDRPLSFFYDRIADGAVEVKTLFGVYVAHSFPSAHTAFAFGAAAGLARAYPRGTWAFFTGALALSLTRIYVGAHFPSDVLAGALIGSAAGWGAGRAMETRFA